MAQDVRELIPRVRRAVEGPVPLPAGALPDAALLAMTADAIADVILMTDGQWAHTLAVAQRTEEGVPDEWTVDPELTLEEESVIAAQAALMYFFHTVKDAKISERIRNEGQEWEYQLSANVLRDWIKLLQGQRDAALAALAKKNPVMARYASFLAVRDSVAAAVLEPWTAGGLGGGQENAALWVPA